MAIPFDIFPNLPIIPYQEARKQIRSGDILLCSGSSMLSGLIKFATKSVWSHVGFVLRVDAIDRIMVMESVEDVGVRTVPLSSYIYSYNGSKKPYPGRILIARHGAFKEVYTHDISQKGVDLLGHPYNYAQILKIAGRLAWLALGFGSKMKTMQDDGAYICSEYAYHIFKSVHVPIQHTGEGFVIPGDFARTEAVNPVCVLS